MRNLLALTLIATSAVFASPAEWPVVKTYEGEYLRAIRMPVGGIGTGCLSISGNGALVDWELGSNPSKGYVPTANSVQSCFMITARGADGQVASRLLEGPLDYTAYEGELGSKAPNHGFPRFSMCKFKTAYPFAQVELSDPKMPVTATLKAMNPLLPGDEENSGLPIASIVWSVVNRSTEPQLVSICFAGPTPCGGECTSAKIEKDESGLVGFVLSGSGDKDAEADSSRGEFAAFVTPGNGKASVSTVRFDQGWNAPLDRLWREFIATGHVKDEVKEVESSKPVRFATVTLQLSLAPGEKCEFPFVLAWRFANRYAWRNLYQAIYPTAFPAAEDVGNYYATRFPSALAAAKHFVANREDFEQRTLNFVNKVCSSRAPAVVREAALANLSTFKTQTCFRTRDGRFYGWEGVFDCAGSCFGSCTHVWGYEHALVEIWPELAKSMLMTQFGEAMHENGMMRFRITLPFSRLDDFDNAAADGQMQCVIKAWEYFNRTSDWEFIKRIYPNVKKAMEFCWLEGGWDADADGLMEGCQHNTMDVDYYGPNPQMEFLYLAALKASVRLAESRDDAAFAAKCRALFEQGSKLAEERLFNGEYYEQIVMSADRPWLKGTQVGWEDIGDKKNPDFQLANGCLIDQLLGDYASRATGLGPMADEAHAKAALAAVLKYNRREPDYDGFNNMRDFVLAGERSLRMAYYPKDKLPKAPFPYYGETMTGFEYVVAASLAQRGDFAAAEEVVRDIRDRYDGRKRNPFNEAECGHHYARALASWTVLKAFE